MTSRNSCSRRLPFQLKEVPDSISRKAEEELNETPENASRGLEEIKRLLAANASTGNIDFEKDFLIQYLRHSKYDAAKAYKYVYYYLESRNKKRYLFDSIPEQYLNTKSVMHLFQLMPQRSSEGCVIMVTELGSWNPDEIPLEDFERLLVMIFVQLLRDPVGQVAGFKFVHDMKTLSLKHLKYMTPNKIYLLYYLAIYCIPGRWKEIHFINTSFAFSSFWAIMRTFLSDKIRNRVFLHSKTEEILQHFPADNLPVKYGGNVEDNYNTEWMKTAHKEHKSFHIGGQQNIF